MISGRPKVFLSRLRWIFKNYPVRWVRLFDFKYFRELYIYRHASSKLEWMAYALADYFFMIFDLLLIPDIYNFMVDGFKKVRPIRVEEREMATRYFDNSICYDCVLIDEKALIGTEKLSVAYVSFFTINTRKEISLSLLMHELMHIWQYQQFGSRYIFHALLAQRSGEAYDYGGVQGLHTALKQNAPMHRWNFEQMAQIVEDAARINLSKSDRIPSQHLGIYESYINQWLNRVA